MCRAVPVRPSESVHWPSTVTPGIFAATSYSAFCSGAGTGSLVTKFQIDSKRSDWPDFGSAGSEENGNCPSAFMMGQSFAGSVGSVQLRSRVGLLANGGDYLSADAAS